jgi:hypothetical protein
MLALKILSCSVSSRIAVSSILVASLLIALQV